VNFALTSQVVCIDYHYLKNAYKKLAKECFMTVLGLSVIDILVVLAYLFGMVYIGKMASKNVKGQTDFFLAGRKLGKVVQFFLNFGQMTDAGGAATASSFVFKSGAGGIWLGMQTLFMTPYYWFMNVWFRRVRLVTMAELFEDRFGGKGIATLYVTFTIFTSIITIGFSDLISLRIIEAIMVKPAAEYTQTDTAMLAQYEEYTALNQQYLAGKLPVESRTKYETLTSLKEKGEISPYATYLDENWFYIIYSVAVGLYIVLGGFEAAAITNTIQGILIIIFSVMLIPFGLAKTGGFTGLHDKVPDVMFTMFGDVTTGEFTWFSVLAILLVSIVQINGIMGNMSIAGSAKDEMAARFGAVSGGFAKRFMIIAWGFCGLLAYALYRDTITNPDTTWGVLTKNLLGPGTIGLMIAGILAANMSTLAAIAMQISALFVRHIYQPFFKNRSEKEYVFVGRLAIVLALVLGIFVAKYTQSVLALLKFMLGAGVTFGAPVLLMFFWRKLTKTAVIIQVVVCIIAFFILPLCLPFVGKISGNPQLTVFTNAKFVEKQVAAAQSDVEQGLATSIGQQIIKQVQIKPAGIYFDIVSHSNPYDLSSPLVGKGFFRIELYLMDKIGFDFSNYTSAGLLTARYTFISIFPFLLLFILSPITKQAEEKTIKAFYAKMSTQVKADPAEDLKEVELTLANPHRFDHKKLFPNSQWEFQKWDRADTVGFALCWVGVAVVLAILWLMLNIGR